MPNVILNLPYFIVIRFYLISIQILHFFLEIIQALHFLQEMSSHTKSDRNYQLNKRNFHLSDDSDEKNCYFKDSSLSLQHTSSATQLNNNIIIQKESSNYEDLIHPLDDLTDREIKKAVQLMKAELGYPKRLGFCQLQLNEPVKQAVLEFDSGIQKVNNTFYFLYFL